MNAAEVVIPAIASIVVSVISGVSAYLLSKNSSRTKHKLSNEIRVKNEIFKPLHGCLSMNKITSDSLDSVVNDIKSINRIINEDYEHYLLIPPEITLTSRNLSQIIEKAEQHSEKEWTDTLKKDILNRYKELRMELQRFENIIRKDLCYPSNGTFQTIRYSSDDPAFTIYILSVICVAWMAVFITFIILNNNFAVIVFTAASAAISILICVVKNKLQRHREKKYFMPLSSSKKK